MGSMLYVPGSRYRESVPRPDGEPLALIDDILWMVKTILRYRQMVVAIGLALVALATLFVLVRPPSFTAASQVQISNLRLLTSRDDTFFTETQVEPRFIETQLQIFRSEEVAYNVVDNLNLPQLLAEGGTTATVTEPASSEPAAESKSAVPSSARREALKMVQRGLSVEQVGLSEVVQVTFTANDRDLSALIANDIVRAYIQEQQKARDIKAQAGSSWLRERLREVGPRAHILTVASPPEYSSNVRGLLIIAAAGIIGGVIAASIALLRGVMDRSIRMPEQVTAAGKFLGVFSAVSRSKRPGFLNSIMSYFVKPRPRSLNPEWYTCREIEAAINAASPDAQCKTVGIVSTQRNEGRSHVSTVLAKSLAASGKKVLLIDTDLLGGQSSQRLGEEKHGLVQLQEGSSKLLTDVIRTDGDVHFIPSGARSLSDRIDWASSMKRLLEAISEKYDYILFDLPPLNMAGDVSDAMKTIDQVLLVIGSGQIRDEYIDCALASVPPLRSKLIGYVINNVDLDAARWLPSVELDLIRRRSQESMVSRKAFPFKSPFNLPKGWYGQKSK